MKAEAWAKKEWTKKDLSLYGLEGRSFFAWLRTSKITRAIGKILGLSGLEIKFEFPRGFVRYMKSRNNPLLVGAEIGVAMGEHAESILKELSIKKLYLIDVYSKYDKCEKFNITDEKWCKKAERKLKGFKDKIEFIKKFSSDAVKDIPNKLDFVYVDGNHSYEYIKEDIRNYYPKLKKGGVLAGHDFDYLSPGVIKAVVEFVSENKLELNTHPFQSDWWVIKK